MKKIYLFVIVIASLIGIALLVSAGYELPNNQKDDSSGTTGINMTGNVLLFHLNNDSAYGENSTNAYDFSNKSNNGTIYGLTWISSGKIGGAYNFSGLTNNYIKVLRTTSLEPASAITVSMWIKTSQWGSLGYALSKKYDSNGASYAFYNFNGIKFYVKNTAGTKVTPSSSINVLDNNWHLLTGTYNTSGVSLYVDGAFQGITSTSGNLIYNVNNLTIGRYNENDAGNYFNGIIDEVAIWNRSLSKTEILNIFNQQNSTNPITCTPTTNQTLTNTILNCNIYQITGNSITILINSTLNASDIWIQSGSQIQKDGTSLLQMN